MDLLFPISARIGVSAPRYISNAASSRSQFTGQVLSTTRTGDRIGFGIATQSASNSETYRLKAALSAYLARMRGLTNRFWFADPGYQQAGSFPSTELLTNNTFASGTSGYSVTNGGALTVADRVARMTVTAAGALQEFYQTQTTTAYLPYAIRAFRIDGPSTSGKTIGPFLHAGTNALGNYSAAAGLITLSGVTPGGSSIHGISGWTADAVAGSYFEIPYLSLSRVPLIDNGPNLLTYSDQFDNAAWNKNEVTVSANTGATAAPDGTATADNVVETTANNTHYVSRSETVPTAAADYSFAIALKTNGRSHCWLQLGGGSGTAFVYFNVITGVFSGSAGSSSDWSNHRYFSKDMGNGWWYFCIVARKAAGVTSMSVAAGAATSDGVNSYTGTTGHGMFNWRATLAQSSVPTRLVQTVASALPTGTAQTGNALYVKGLPASTSGLLLQDDRCQIGKQLNVVVSSLNSDAAQLGYLQCAIPWRASIADNAPVILNNPMMHAIFNDNAQGYETYPGQFSDFDFAFEESCET